MLTIRDFFINRNRFAFGIGCVGNTFSWKLVSERKNVVQHSYQILISGENFSYDSGEVLSCDCLNIPVPVLSPECRYTARLTVHDNYGEHTQALLEFETGIADISGEFIAPDREPAPACSELVRKVHITKPICRARIYATALGLYQLMLDGKKIGENCLAPFWTPYQKRLEYQTYDVTALLHEGESTLVMALGKGWYRGRIGFEGKSEHYGKVSAGWLVLAVDYADGTSERIVTDEQWTARTSYLSESEIYDGETQNFTAEMITYGVKKIPFDMSVILPQLNEPVRITEEIAVVSIKDAPNGEKIFDFGQNLTGVVAFSIEGHAGEILTLRHAEVLDEAGNLYTDNLRTAKATDIYVLDGQAHECIPLFTFHGFRYMGVRGPADAMKNVRACVMHSDIVRTGTVKTNSKRLNRLAENAAWGQRDNFLDVPTDCPQRDERLGWLGDANVFAGTAMLQFCVDSFFRKWLGDIRCDQRADGAVPSYSPDVYRKEYNVSFWADCLPMVTWLAYERYADISILSDNFPAVEKYLESLRANCGDNGLICKGHQIADWLALDNDFILSKTDYGATDRYFIANVFYLQSVNAASKIAHALSETKAEDKYAALEEKLTYAFRREYVTAGGRLVSETQTALSLALVYPLTEEKNRPAIAKRLADSVKKHGNHLVTGFVGTPRILFALSDSGYHDVAADMLFVRGFPGWMYPISKGATTIWERWNGIKPDGSFFNPAMNSFNHYSYGSVIEFVYRRVAGIEALEAGYRRIRLAPRLTMGISHIRVTFDSAYGMIVSEYEQTGNHVTFRFEVPANTTAEIILPDGKYEVGSGQYTYTIDMEKQLGSMQYLTLETTTNDIVSDEELLQALNNVSGGRFQAERLALAQGAQLGQLAAYLGPHGKEMMSALIDAANRFMNENDREQF